MKGYKGVRIFQGALKDENINKAAIAVFDNQIDVIQYPELTTNNIVVVSLRTSAWEVTLVSFYFEPDKPIEPYVGHLKRIERRFRGGKILLGGDANAKNPWWGGTKLDSKGEYLSGTLEELGLNILNNGNIPTFDTVRGGIRYSSYVDLTVCTTDLLSLVDDWKVEVGMVGSDHNGINFKLLLKPSTGIQINRTTRVYNTKKANWAEFREKFSQLTIENNLTLNIINETSNINQVDSIINTYTKIITEASDKAIPKKKNTEKIFMPWWSEKLAKMKRGVATRRRRIRWAAPVRRVEVIEHVRVI